MKTELHTRSINGCKWVIEETVSEHRFVWIVKAFRGGIKRYEARHFDKSIAQLMLSEQILKSAI